MKQPPRDRTCSNCNHWNVDAEDLDAGECRAFPPEVLYDPDHGSFTVWRMTASDDWCGLHRARTQ